MISLSNNIPGNPRIASQQELSAMLVVVARHDNAKQAQNYDALIATFDASAFCELKPAGLRITSINTLADMYRRTLPALSASFLARRKTRQWSNQTGLVREWLYPVKLPSGEEILTRQLEVFEFAEGLAFIKSYRVRMNLIYSRVFVDALGEDYATSPGIERIPG